MIGTYHFYEVRKRHLTPISRNHCAGEGDTFWKFYLLHVIIMTLTCSRSTHCLPHVYSAPLEHFVAHSDKRCLVSNSFFTHPPKCSSSYFFTTWPFLSTPTRFHLSSVVHSSRTHAVTFPIVGVFGTLFGAALLRFSHVHGWQFTRIFLVLRRGRGRIVFKDGYGTQFSRLPSTAFHYLYVRCSYPSIF